MTRRQLAASLLTAIPVAAQTAETPKDDLNIQRENLKRNMGFLDKVQVPIATEPSVIFKP